jgi:hypothetical protein
MAVLGCRFARGRRSDRLEVGQQVPERGNRGPSRSLDEAPDGRYVVKGAAHNGAHEARPHERGATQILLPCLLRVFRPSSD